MDLYLLFQNQFYEGDLIARVFLGVFDTHMRAEEHAFVISQDDDMFDPTYRVKCEIIPALLNAPIWPEEF